MNLQNKKVLVVGSGKSGIGAVRMLGKLGALPVLFDSNEKLDKEELLKKTGKIPGMEILLGSVPKERKKEFFLVVISPGVPVDAPWLSDYRALNIPIWGESSWQAPMQRERLSASREPTERPRRLL